MALNVANAPRVHSAFVTRIDKSGNSASYNLSKLWSLLPFPAFVVALENYGVLVTGATDAGRNIPGKTA